MDGLIIHDRCKRSCLRSIENQIMIREFQIRHQHSEMEIFTANHFWSRVVYFGTSTDLYCKRKVNLTYWQHLTKNGKRIMKVTREIFWKLANSLLEKLVKGDSNAHDFWHLKPVPIIWSKSMTEDFCLDMTCLAFLDLGQILKNNVDFYPLSP